jgi:hypothetical protein
MGGGVTFRDKETALIAEKRIVQTRRGSPEVKARERMIRFSATSGWHLLK